MTAQCTRLRLRVVPGSSRPGVVGRHGDGWKLRVAAPPEDGRANEEVLDLLAESLSIARGDLDISTGLSSRDKIVALRGLSPADAEMRLVAASERRR